MKKHWVYWMFVLGVCATVILSCQSKEIPDEFGMPPTIRSNVLGNAAPGSTILSAQLVQKDGLKMWCVVTSHNDQLERWIASDLGEGKDTSIAAILQATNWESFERIGCTNWSGAQSIQPAISSATPAPALPSKEALPGGASATFQIEIYSLVLNYPPGTWQTNPDGLSLQLVLQPTCVVQGPKTLYDKPPDRSADREVILGGMTYDVYIYEVEQGMEAMYRAREIIEGNEVFGEATIYVDSNKTSWDVCDKESSEILTTLHSKYSR